MLWLAVDQSRITDKNKLFVKLCLIYACQNSELRLSEKDHFDLKPMFGLFPLKITSLVMKVASLYCDP
jgi:hypothetical protein